MQMILQWFALAFSCATACATTVQSRGDLEQANPGVKRATGAPAVAPTADHASPLADAGALAPEAQAAKALRKCAPIEDPPAMLLVPAGTFTMGADAGGEEDEHPAHSVTLEAFWLDVNEATVQDYLQCVNAGVCRKASDRFELRGSTFTEARFRQPRQPITGISWEDARTYCTFRGKRLPREAEWEHAARGDDARTYPWGQLSPNPLLHGCFARALGTPSGTTCVVGSYPAGAGPYGHQDLAGNVWEWMADYYDPFAYRRAGAVHGDAGDCHEILETQNWLRSNNRQGFTGTNPIPTACEHVLRGGAFNYPASGIRSSNRVHHPGEWRLLMAGVRCAKDQAVQAASTSDGPCQPDL